MKSKKIFFLIFLLLVITGCKATYNIDIYNDEVNEEFSFFEDDTSKWDSSSIGKAEEYGPSEYVPSSKTYREKVQDELALQTQAFVGMGEYYYKKTLLSSDTKLGIKYNYVYKLDEYNDSFIANSCFEYFNVVKDDKDSSGNQRYILSTSKGFNCMDKYNNLDLVTVKFSTNHDVISTNSDRSENGYYYWDINKNNATNKSIYIELNVQEANTKEKNKIFNKTLLIVFISVAILIFIVIIFLRKRDKRNNEI